jgi:hypothetical protein
VAKFVRNDQPDFYEKVALTRGTDGRIQWDTHPWFVQAVNMRMKIFLQLYTEAVWDAEVLLQGVNQLKK